MTKTELTAYLDERLSMLNSRERDDIKQEYAQHIDMKMRDGMSELEAVESLGDISTIVDDILMAYNIDPEYQKAKSTAGAAVKNAADKVKNVIGTAAGLVRANTPLDLVKLLFKLFFFSLLVLMLFSCGFGIFSAMAEIMHSCLPHVFMIDDIVSASVKLFYVVVFIIVIGGFIWNLLNGKMEGMTVKDVHENEFVGVSAGGNAEPVSIQTDETPRRHAKIMENVDFSEWIKDMIMFLIKFCIVWVSIPFFFALIGCVVTQGVLVAAMITGYPVVGLNIGCLGVNLCLVSLIMAVVKFVLYKKEERKK